MIVLLLLAGLGYGGWWWWQQRQGPPAPQVLATETLERRTVREVLEATGIVKSQVGAVVKIGVQANGRITNLPYRIGDPVEKGALIAQLDDRELQAQKRQVEADIRRYEAELDFSRRFHARQRDLLRGKAIDANTVEDAERSMAVNEAALATARAQLEAIHIRLSYHKIYSPLAGVVGNVTAQEGETVVAGLQAVNLVTVINPSRLEMWIYMDETDIGRVIPGQQVEFTVDAYPDEVFTTEVEQIYPIPEIRDSIVYYQVLCRISTEQATRLRPEMTTQCRVVVQAKPDALALPNTALKWVDKRNVVYVVMRTPETANATAGPPPTQLRAEGQDFTLGLRGPAYSEVLTGFAEGEVVATQVVVPQARKATAAASQGASSRPPGPPGPPPGGPPPSGSGGGPGGGK
ncbi:putative RND family efflux transporter MFP subunit [Megalodesulfovibrio gigas DSM 1382 = ATCC 19364]|uniref:Putative RND family efflux transporter MFP subunit n=1 Tax=Megalodesulfovibrio gigas (strain ATCC 19364 / DSM 1382 / NCIMB 9332 / VKM B-1759) TaxID=1121448 RepID=T2GEX4_MEGG1|nr:putative RND family efflux transporter MFP subunit [Megalodesulfovibrio gigas DSM 1382 = ATCC 19364]